MTLYLIPMYGKVTEFTVDCMKCDCGHVTTVTILARVYKYYRGWIKLCRVLPSNFYNDKS